MQGDENKVTTGKEAADILFNKLDWKGKYYSFKQLEEIANSEGPSSDLKKAARYFVDHKDEFSRMETNSTGRNDKIISKLNVGRYIQDQNAIGEYNKDGISNEGLRTIKDIVDTMRQTLNAGNFKTNRYDDGTYSLRDLNDFVVNGAITDKKTVAAIRLLKEHEDMFKEIDIALTGPGSRDLKISLHDLDIISQSTGR